MKIGPISLSSVQARTAVDAVHQFLEKVEELDDSAIFISVGDPAALLDIAAEVDAAPPEERPLRGLVFAAKDNIDVAGMPTTAACPGFAYEPRESATVVARLLAAGAIPVAKTNLDQFATGLVGTRSPYGIPTNPLSPELIPGGSSSGSAVSVRRGLVDFALGTDTAGSGRVPAAMCSLVGLKPTVGRLPNTGVVPAVRTADCVSVFAPSVALACRVAEIAEGPDGADSLARIPDTPWTERPVSVGVVSADVLTAWGAELDIVGYYQQAVAALEAAKPEGAMKLVEFDPEPLFAVGDLLYGGPFVAERTAAVGEFIAKGGEGLDPTVAGIIGGGANYSAVDAYRATYRLADLRQEAEAALEGIDCFLLPTIPRTVTKDEVAADPVAVNSDMGRFTTFTNLLDQCALSVPVPSPEPTPGASVTFYATSWKEPLLADVASVLNSGELPGHYQGVRLVVAGAHLRGEALEHQLTELHAVWEQTTKTEPSYRLYALPGGPIRKPALIHDPTGAAIEVDTWRLTTEALGRFLTMVPPPLALGTVTLADGSEATGFVAEPRAVEGATEITDLGGWRAFMASLDD